jgi:SAM-dependent methyltransferase
MAAGVTPAPGPVTGWTIRHARHAAAILKQDRNPAARVYESIGPDCFLALAPGWLNLGLWEGPGCEAEAACHRMVRTLALALPAGGTILDVGNGLATQDPLIAEAVAGDAVRLPIAGSTIDGVISVEAAFHFRSRQGFFGECYRVLRRGGALSISDIAIRRWPASPGEVLAGLTQLRVFGLQRSMAMTAGQIAAAARAAGLAGVQVTTCGDRVIAPALRLTAQRLASTTAAPAGQRAAARLLLRQADLLWRRRIIDYLLLRAVRP